jgi:hypothetical protein
MKRPHLISEAALENIISVSSQKNGVNFCPFNVSSQFFGDKEHRPEAAILNMA